MLRNEVIKVVILRIKFIDKPNHNYSDTKLISKRWLINFFIVGVNLLCLMISSIFYKHLSTVEDTITYGTKYDTQICVDDYTFL